MSKKLDKKLKKLKAMGGIVTTVQDFRGFTNEEMAVIEARLALAKAIRDQHEEAGLTQAALAKSLGSSQARVARMEGGDPQLLAMALILLFARPALPRGRAATRRPASTRRSVHSQP